MLAYEIRFTTFVQLTLDKKISYIDERKFKDTFLLKEGGDSSNQEAMYDESCRIARQKILDTINALEKEANITAGLEGRKIVFKNPELAIIIAKPTDLAMYLNEELWNRRLDPDGHSYTFA